MSAAPPGRAAGGATPAGGEPFSWRAPRFTYADALTGARLVMLPYLIYGLAARAGGLVLVTLGAMILSDIVDGKVARRLGQARPFGAALDSGIDFVVIYSLFTVLFLMGALPWWKWAVICAPAALMAAAQLLHLLRASTVEFAPALAGKAVGAIQFAYLPLLVVRTLWPAGWMPLADDLVFVALAAGTVVNTVDYARTLAALLRDPGSRAPTAPPVTG